MKFRRSILKTTKLICFQSFRIHEHKLSVRRKGQLQLLEGSGLIKQKYCNLVNNGIEIRLDAAIATILAHVHITSFKEEHNTALKAILDG